MMRLMRAALRRSNRFISVLIFVLFILFLKYEITGEKPPYEANNGASLRKLTSNDPVAFSDDSGDLEPFDFKASSRTKRQYEKDKIPIRPKYDDHEDLEPSDIKAPGSSKREYEKDEDSFGPKSFSWTRRNYKDSKDSKYTKERYSSPHKLYIVPGRKRQKIQMLRPRMFPANVRDSRGQTPWQKLALDDKRMDLKEEIMVKKDDPVSRAPKPTSGEPWPIPQIYTKNSTVKYKLDPSEFNIRSLVFNCDILESAIVRFRKRMEVKNGYHVAKEDSNNNRPMNGIHINVTRPCSSKIYPTLESDESYELSIRGDNIILQAPEVWGAIYGLETFSQLIQEGVNGQLFHDSFYIRDFPRFKHRGIMIDTSRHYLSTSIIKKNLDAMSMNKFNVLHWHIVDDQSFPYVSMAFPELDIQGAYSPLSVYRVEDIADIIEHARVRGIRVIPEFDTPGHVQSWLGLKHILTPCDSESSYGPIDPSKNMTYKELKNFFSEVLNVFPGQTIHFGGDECSYYCWANNDNVRRFMEAKSMGKDYRALFNHFITSLRLELRKNNLKPKNSIYWQEVYDENVEMDADDIIQVWKGQHELELSKITMRGHKVILSSCWYLNHIRYGTDWQDHYTCDPLRFSGNPDQKQLVLGGEACMWGEYVDDTNLLQYLWPRASAVAERLWSSYAHMKPDAAGPRFEENRCRLIRNGIPASPNSGPGPNC